MLEIVIKRRATFPQDSDLFCDAKKEDAIENQDEEDLKQSWEEAQTKDEKPTILTIQQNPMLMMILNTKAWNALPKILILLRSGYNRNAWSGN